MATGIQGPQGFKGPRGVAGATGWGAIGSTTGPTGPTGPMGFFTLQSSVSSSVEITPNTVSTLYSVTSSGLTISTSGTLTAGAFWVFTNQTDSTCTISVTGITINGSSSSRDLLVGNSFMLVYRTGIDFIASYTYSGLGGSPGLDTTGSH